MNIGNQTNSIPLPNSPKARPLLLVAPFINKFLHFLPHSYRKMVWNWWSSSYFSKNLKTMNIGKPHDSWWRRKQVFWGITGIWSPSTFFSKASWFIINIQSHMSTLLLFSTLSNPERHFRSELHCRRRYSANVKFIFDHYYDNYSNESNSFFSLNNYFPSTLDDYSSTLLLEYAPDCILLCNSQ